MISERPEALSRHARLPFKLVPYAPDLGCKDHHTSYMFNISSCEDFTAWGNYDNMTAKL